MVFRLFVGRERDVTIQDLVASLLIDDPAKASELADLLREVRHLDRFAAIDRLASRTGIWLGGLRPRVHGEILRSMELVPWRGRHEIPLKWSGLTPRDGKLVLLLDRRPDAKSPGRREVRWRTTPDKLREGAATYTIEVCSDDEVLASGQLTHRGENPQKFVFALDHFESLQSDQVFEPLVRISAQGTEPLTTEIFRLEFGEAPERGIGGSAGRRVRCVGEGLLAAKDAGDSIAPPVRHTPSPKLKRKSSSSGDRQDRSQDRSRFTDRPSYVKSKKRGINESKEQLVAGPCGSPARASDSKVPSFTSLSPVQPTRKHGGDSKAPRSGSRASSARDSESSRAHSP